MPDTETTAGEKLRDSITAEVEEAGLELDAREAEFLARAVDVADSIAALEAALAETGQTIQAPKGLLVNPLVGEIRQQRAQLVTLLKSIDLKGAGQTAASAHGRAAAQKRWGTHRQQAV